MLLKKIQVIITEERNHPAYFLTQNKNVYSNKRESKDITVIHCRKVRGQSIQSFASWDTTSAWTAFLSHSYGIVQAGVREASTDTKNSKKVLPDTQSELKLGSRQSRPKWWTHNFLISWNIVKDTILFLFGNTSFECNYERYIILFLQLNA